MSCPLKIFFVFKKHTNKIKKTVKKKIVQTATIAVLFVFTFVCFFSFLDITLIVVIVEVLYPVEVSFVVVVPLLYVRVEARGTVEALTVEHDRNPVVCFMFIKHDFN